MKTVKRIFLVLFSLSTLGVLLLWPVFSQTASLPSPVTQDPGINSTPSPATVDPSSQNTREISLTALIGSMITSVTSLIGFITTTVIAWRKEKRENSLADVERKKLETELEKNKLELEDLKKARQRKKTKSEK